MERLMSEGVNTMHKFFMAIILLSVPISTGALVHSGSEQEQQACTRDVQRFCRKMMDQGDLTILACLKENRSKLSHACRDVLVSHGQ
jgi:Cysteine rich repeat